MDAHEFQEFLYDLLQAVKDGDVSTFARESGNALLETVLTYEEALMLTHDCGVVVRMAGSEFRVSIHQVT